jgi:hypothetical protein
MGWKRDAEKEREYECFCFEVFHRDDDGVYFGCVMQFYEDGPAYANNELRRIGGAWTTIADARYAVEQDGDVRNISAVQ